MPSDRYDRFRRLNDLGAQGLERLADAHVAILGMGVIGCYMADLLVRLGVKNLRIIDRDTLQPSDLGHQILYIQDDVARELPKVEAAAKRLTAVNPSTKVEGIFADINPKTILDFLKDVDIVLEGLDNLAARFLLNDAALELKLPWVFCSAAGMSGMVVGIPAGGKPCLRCLVRDYPSSGSTPTCDAVGIWTPTAHWAAGHAVWLAAQSLQDNWNGWGKLTTMDRFPDEIRAVTVNRDPSCPACATGQRAFLKGDKYPKAFQLCGRDEVTILSASDRRWDIQQIRKQWDGPGELETTPYFVRWRDNTRQVLIFDDGRVLIRGVQSVEDAQRLWGRLFTRWI